MRGVTLSRLVGSLGLSLLALSACQSEDPRAQLASQPRGVEGRWSSVGGPVAYNAIFQNGRFTSVERATNGLLASGTYSNLGPGQINIVYTLDDAKTSRSPQIANQVQPQSPVLRDLQRATASNLSRA